MFKKKLLKHATLINRLTILSSVFHRILDFKAGWISIRPLFFYMFTFLSHTSAIIRKIYRATANKKFFPGLLSHCRHIKYVAPIPIRVRLINKVSIVGFTKILVASREKDPNIAGAGIDNLISIFFKKLRQLYRTKIMP